MNSCGKTLERYFLNISFENEKKKKKYSSTDIIIDIHLKNGEFIRYIYCKGRLFDFVCKARIIGRNIRQQFTSFATKNLNNCFVIQFFLNYYNFTNIKLYDNYYDV